MRTIEMHDVNTPKTNAQLTYHIKIFTIKMVHLFRS